MVVSIGLIDIVWHGSLTLLRITCHARIQRGERGRGSRPPLKIHKAIGFHINTGPDPLRNH